jgi:hypothetical protein
MSPTSQDLAILFADVSGSTALYEKLGDQEALAIIDEVLGELKKSVAIQKGRVVKTIGDELMAALPSANHAMLASCDMQNRVAAIPPRKGVKVAIRIGFHFGPVIEDEADFYGDAVNVAARMAELAKAGQIITSMPSVKLLSPLLRKDTRDLDSVSVKGKQEEIRIFEIFWQHSDDLTMASSPLVPETKPEPKLTLRHGGQTLELGTARPSAAMGRDAANDLVTADKKASRVHAKIEYRRGQFFLVDQSTNGTYVTSDGHEEIMLKREQVMLRGRGVFSFGHSASTDGGEVVNFSVEQ